MESKQKEKLEESNTHETKNKDNKKEQNDTNNDEEISIDFSKIKAGFKKLFSNSTKEHKKVTKASKDEDDLAIDFKKIWSFFVKYKMVFLIIIPLLLAIFIRVQGADLPQATNWATNSVQNFVKGDISNIVNQQYPNLPPEVRAEIVNEEFQKAWGSGQYTLKYGQYKGQVVNLKQQIKGTAEQFKKAFQYEFKGKSYVYMPDIDPYTYLRYARNQLETGEQCDTIKDGQKWETHMAAPLGRSCEDRFHPSVLVLIHKVISFFNPNIPLMHSATYFPVIMVALSIIPAFFTGQMIAGGLGGFFTALMVAISPAGLGRTLWGRADTDAYNFIFPLVAIWLFFLMFNAKELKKKLAYGTGLGLTFGIYAHAWVGWWYVFDFLLAILGLYLIYQIAVDIIKHKKFNFKKLIKEKSIKNTLISLGIFILMSGTFITLLNNFQTFWSTLLQPFNFMSIKDASSASLWPNVYTTVAELNSASWNSIIGSIGGKFLFYVAILGILLTLLIKNKEGKFDPKYFLLLAIWFPATLYAATKGIRFTLLLVPGFAIAFGSALGLSYKHLTKFFEKSLNLPQIITGILLLLVFGVMLIQPIKAAYYAPQSDVPLINDAWVNALEKIKTDSQTDAIINSWWDFGHHFKYFADRAVTFDGASQNTPMAHWIGKVLLTSNEKEAIGILRMLDCGSNSAFEAIDAQLKDPSQSVRLIKKAILEDKNGARELFENAGLSEVDDLLKKTHCAPPENYFIASQDMISKAGVWAHFGSWDFEKADLWINMKDLPVSEITKQVMEKYGYSKDDAEGLAYSVKSVANEKDANQWIAPWPNYASGVQSCTKQNDEILICGQGIQINLTNYETVLYTQKGKVNPNSIVYIDENLKFVEKKFENPGEQISVSLIPANQNNYMIVLSSPEIATSMFNRMFFYQAHDLNYFKELTVETQPNGGLIFVYKVDWKGNVNNILESIKPKDTVKAGSKVEVDYTGWFESGEIFDTSIQNWKTNTDVTNESEFSNYESVPLPFIAGTGQMIPGFDRAVIGMKLGEEKIVKLSPQDAYGTDPEKHPLGNMTLNFKIRVQSIDGYTLKDLERLTGSVRNSENKKEELVVEKIMKNESISEKNDTALDNVSNK